jgi:hypothetical protein
VTAVGLEELGSAPEYPRSWRIREALLAHSPQLSESARCASSCSPPSLSPARSGSGRPCGDRSGWPIRQNRWRPPC